MDEKKWTARELGRMHAGLGERMNASIEMEYYSLSLVQGTNIFGDRIYCYVKIPSERVDEVDIALQATEGTFDIREYGEIVAAGKGDPDPDVHAEVMREYEIYRIDDTETADETPDTAE